MTAQLHLAINAFALQLLLERAKRLVDIIVANDDLHKSPNLLCRAPASATEHLPRPIAQRLTPGRAAAPSTASNPFQAQFCSVGCDESTSPHDELSICAVLVIGD
jgi:hypothetical protein